MAHKNETFHIFTKFHRKVSNEKGFSIQNIRSDHGTEFENQDFENFCDENGIGHNFSAPRTPQQNGVVERKNRILKKMAHTMLCKSDIPRYFWTEAINTACYILNRALIRQILKKPPYELWKERKPNIAYFHIFGCRCFVLNNGKERLGKFDAKSDEAILLGYSSTSKAFRVFNKRTLVVEESIHVVFDESNDLPSRKNKGVDDADPLIEGMKEITLKDSATPEDKDQEEEQNEKGEEIQEQPQGTNDLPKEWRYVHNHLRN